MSDTSDSAGEDELDLELLRGAARGAAGPRSPAGARSPAALARADGGSVTTQAAEAVGTSRFTGVVRHWDSASGTGFLTCAHLSGDIFLSGELNQIDALNPLKPGEDVTFAILDGVGDLRKCYTAVGIRRLAATAAVQTVRAGKRGSRTGAQAARPPQTIPEVLDAMRSVSAGVLVAAVVAHLRATDMSDISRGAMSGPMAKHAAQAARRRQVADKLTSCAEAKEYALWYFEQMLLAITVVATRGSAATERALRRSEKLSMTRLDDLDYADDTLARFRRVLDAMGLLEGTPDVEVRLLMSNVSIALTKYRTAQLDSSTLTLPAFQPSFRLDDRDPWGAGGVKFSYIIGWLLFKLGRRTAPATSSGSARAFVQALVLEHLLEVDPSTGRQERHIVPRAEAVQFGAVVERLVLHLFEGCMEALGSALLPYVKASVLANLQVQEAWEVLVRATTVSLDSLTSHALRLLWVEFYMKSRQKEYLRSKGWLPKPQPTLRAALRGKSSVHVDRDKPKPEKVDKGGKRKREETQAAKRKQPATEAAPAPARVARTPPPARTVAPVEPAVSAARTPARPVVHTERGSQSQPRTVERFLSERPAALHPRTAPTPGPPASARFYAGARRSLAQQWPASPAGRATPSRRPAASVGADTPLVAGVVTPARASARLARADRAVSARLAE